jgi:hypothetical protein
VRDLERARRRFRRTGRSRAWLAPRHRGSRCRVCRHTHRRSAPNRRQQDRRCRGVLRAELTGGLDWPRRGCAAQPKRLDPSPWPEPQGLAKPAPRTQ